MSEQSYVSVDPQQVSNGVAQWNAASGPLETAWTDALGKITALNTTATWGADDAGNQFNTSYMVDGKAGEFETNGQPLIDQVTGLGDKVSTAASLSLGADESQEAKMKIDIEVNLPSISS